MAKAAPAPVAKTAKPAKKGPSTRSRCRRYLAGALSCRTFCFLAICFIIALASAIANFMPAMKQTSDADDATESEPAGEAAEPAGPPGKAAEPAGPPGRAPMPTPPPRPRAPEATFAERVAPLVRGYIAAHYAAYGRGEVTLRQLKKHIVDKGGLGVVYDDLRDDRYSAVIEDEVDDIVKRCDGGDKPVRCVDPATADEL